MKKLAVIEKIITVLAGFVIATLSNLGYGGIVLLMAIESACLPQLSCPLPGI